jgi:hypothetical protein
MSTEQVIGAFLSTKKLNLYRRLTLHVYRTRFRRVSVYERKGPNIDGSMYMSKEKVYGRLSVRKNEAYIDASLYMYTEHRCVWS